jgi:hypothetical protein
MALLESVPLKESEITMHFFMLRCPFPGRAGGAWSPPGSFITNIAGPGL